ncbi:MAG: sigma-70 family RNA polymerase sigma factor [Planctomycetota bacterium]|nr:MAG: sigma-70 family RNA polymerase sigma factor [Planctomycetota bacterium]
MSPANEPEQLVQQAIAGDRTALEELLLLHYDRLLARIARKLPTDLRGALSPEDVLQDVFLDVAERIGAFRPDGPEAFARWSATIAEHRLIDLVRSRRAAKRGGGRKAVEAAPGDWSQTAIDILGQIAIHEHTPSRSAAGHEAVAAIRTALERINPDYRDALRMRYVEGLSVAQTAERMGRTPQAIHMLCHRGLSELRDVLGPDSDFLSRKA